MVLFKPGGGGIYRKELKEYSKDSKINHAASGSTDFVVVMKISLLQMSSRGWSVASNSFVA